MIKEKEVNKKIRQSTWINQNDIENLRIPRVQKEKRDKDNGPLGHGLKCH